MQYYTCRSMGGYHKNIFLQWRFTFDSFPTKTYRTPFIIIPKLTAWYDAWPFINLALKCLRNCWWWCLGREQTVEVLSFPAGTVLKNSVVYPELFIQNPVRDLSFVKFRIPLRIRIQTISSLSSHFCIFYLTSFILCLWELLSCHICIPFPDPLRQMQCCESGSGIRCFFDPEKIQKNLIFENLVTNFKIKIPQHCWKILQYFHGTKELFLRRKRNFR
jgi:hypothetical protein